MRKIWTILIIGMIVIGLSSVSASIIPKTENIKSRFSSSVIEKIDERYANVNSDNGNFSGMFAMKNESGYVILGSLEGTYQMSSNNSGTFDGIWNMTDDNLSGTMNGWFRARFFMGQIEQNTGESSWFIGLFRVNTTSNEFGAVALIFSSPCMVRYAAGTFQ
jgi:hypothetical protein